MESGGRWRCVSLLDERMVYTARTGSIYAFSGCFGHLDLVAVVTLTVQTTRPLCHPFTPPYPTPLGFVQQEGHDLLGRFVVDRQTPCIR